MRKTPKAQATNKDIAAAALELFFEKGYENTSIRMIQEKAGKEIGTFYYYYQSKEDALKAAIDLFFESYEKKMREIVDLKYTNQEGILLKYLEYLDQATQSFRAQYVDKLHWSILGAIREHTLYIMQKYILEILEYYQNSHIIDSSINIDVASSTIAYAVGGCILYQSAEEYHNNEQEILKIIPLLINVNQ